MLVFAGEETFCKPVFIYFARHPACSNSLFCMSHYLASPVTVTPVVFSLCGCPKSTTGLENLLHGILGEWIDELCMPGTDDSVLSPSCVLA